MDASRRSWLLWIAAGLLASPTVVRAAATADGPQRVIEVQIENRRVVQPESAIQVTEGDVIELRWTSNEPVELHLHAYDLTIHVRPDEPAVMVINAHATGRFPISGHGWDENDHGHDTLIYLEVYPR